MERARFSLTLIALTSNMILIHKFVTTGDHSNSSHIEWQYSQQCNGNIFYCAEDILWIKTEDAN